MREGGFDSWGGDYMPQDFNYPKSDIEDYVPIPDVPELSFWRLFVFMFTGERTMQTIIELEPSRAMLDQETHAHNEYFCPGEKPGTWEWWEKVSAAEGDGFVTEKVKIFTEETFVEEVLQPMVDHVGECHCAEIRFRVLKSDYTLPKWLTWSPERAHASLPHIDTNDAELLSTIYGDSCYTSQDGCNNFRVASRAGKIAILAQIVSNRPAL